MTFAPEDSGRPAPTHDPATNDGAVGYDRPPMSAKGTPAIDAVRRAGIDHRLHEYETEGPATVRRHGAAGAPESYGEAAAAAIGVPPERVFKTLIASVDGRLVAAVVPVDGELDLKRLAKAFGGRRAVMAEAAEAERAAGSVVGGISPLGLRRPLPLAIDDSAAAHPTIYVSAGRRGLQLELAPADLVRLTSARTAPLARRAFED